MRISFILGYIIVALSASAQTKWIAHKSHSGSMETYRAGLGQHWGDEENSNFGLYIEHYLDSVIAVNDTTTIMVRSTGTRPGARNRVMVRDTVYRLAGTGSKHPLKKIKDSLQKHSYYDNPIDSTKFIGFDKEKKENHVLPLSTAPHNNGPGAQPPLAVFFAVIVMVSLATGWVYYKYQQLKRSF